MNTLFVLKYKSLLLTCTVIVFLTISALNAQQALAATTITGSVTLGSLGAYNTNNVTVKFTLGDTLAPNDKITISFPPGFDIKNLKVDSCDVIDGSFGKSIDNQQLKISYNGESDIPEGTTFNCLLSGIKNPGPGPSGHFTIITTNPGGVIINTTHGISNVNIVSGVLIDAAVAPYTFTVDSLYIVSVDFTTTDPIPKDGKLQIIFPAGFDVSAATHDECNLEVVKTSAANQTVTITRNGNGAVLPAGTVVKCLLNNIKNPAAAHNTDPFTVRITNGAGLKIAEKITPGVAIINGTFSDISITPASKLPDTFNTLTLKFTVNDNWPGNGILTVDLPAGYDASAGNAKVCGVGIMNVEFTTLTIRLTRNGESQYIPAGTATSCELGNIKNPPANSTGTFTVITMANDGAYIDYADGIVAGVIANSTAAPAGGQQATGRCEGFKDVTSADPLCLAIKYVKEKNIFSGYPDGSFKPQNVINRVETTKVILVAFGKTLQNCAGNDGFKDSDATQWYCKYVHTAKLLGILKGYPDGTLRPTQQINRAEMLKIFFVTMGKDISAVTVDENPYPDTPKNEWYSKYVQLAKTNALVDTAADGKFKPSAGMKRGDVAMLFYRAHLAGML